MPSPVEPPSGRRSSDRPLVGVIAAKLAPHRLPRGSVSRPGLLDQLRAGHDRVLTLVSAPAGFGKTTLLTEWATSDSGRSFAWVTLDASDAEPVRLWTHVIASLSAVEPEVGVRSLPSLRAHPDSIADAVLPVLYDELVLGDATVLVLDDYHLAENTVIDRQVEAFQHYRPDNVQLVIATRSDPALGVARLRASGELVEVRAASLAFDESELRQFFAGMGITGLTPHEVHRLAERTGGWPAPVRLAALLLPDADRDSFIDSFTGGSREVVDYLTRDVLDVLEPATRDFLLQVCILSRLNGSLCDAVVGTTGSGALLADLERSNVFVSVDSAGEWYSEHQLFADALRLELTRTRPALVPVLHARAAAWFEDAGDLETATEHAIAARDVPTASRLVAAQVQPMAATGRLAIVRRWLSALSWPEAESDPELAYVRALAATIDNRVDEAVALLELVRTGPPGQLDAAGLPLGFRADYVEGVVGVNEVARAEAAARRAVQTAPSAVWEGFALAGLGQSLYLQGRTDEAVQVLRRAVGQIPDANPLMLALAVGNLALAESALAVPSRADAMLDQVAGLMSTIGSERTPAGAIVEMGCAERDRRRGDLRSASRRLEHAIAILASRPRSAWLANAYLLLATVHRALGSSADAVAALDHADAVLDRLADPGDLRRRSARLRALVVAPVRHASEFGEVLSERETAVLRLASAGLAQRQIADQLFISYNTVKSHLKTSYRKLGVTSRQDAIARFALLELDDPDLGEPDLDERRTRRSRLSPG